MTRSSRVWPAAALRRLGAYARDTSASVTMEFVLWVPVFCGLLMLFADTSLAYMNQSNFWNVSRETARIVARHGLDEEAAVNFAETHASFGKYRPDAKVTIDGSTVTVTITADARAVTLFGILNFAGDQTIGTTVTDVLEPI
jgi:Flp pilus assembly protein TadG